MNFSNASASVSKSQSLDEINPVSVHNDIEDHPLNGTGDPDMSQQALDEITVRQYLLDELTPDARQRLEERLLTEDDFFTQLLTLEEEQEDALIEQYVYGELSEHECEKFERVFLSTRERHEKLDLVKDLKKHAPVPAAQAQAKGKDKKKRRWFWFSSFLTFLHLQNPRVGFSLAVALLLAVLGNAWLFSRFSRLESEVSRLKAEQGAVPSPAATPAQDVQEQVERLRARNEELEADLRRADEERAKLNQQLAVLKGSEQGAKVRPVQVPSPPRQAPVFSLTLPLIRIRDSELGREEGSQVPAGTARLQLLLDLDVIDPDDYRNYQVVLKKRDGTVIWRDKNPQIIRGEDRNQIAVRPPTNLLSGGVYLMELSGVGGGGTRTQVGIYVFRVNDK